MATLKLTDGEVEGVEPTGRDIYLWDSALPRFGVRITPAGARIYLVQYRAKTAPGMPSKTRRMTIGVHDRELWNATKARARARRLLGPVDGGADPFAERVKRAKAEAAEEREADKRERDKFEAVVERYIELCMKTNRSGRETARLLRHDAVPAWTGRHIGELRRADVGELIDAIKQRSPAVARAVYAALRGLFRWCIERDLIDSSPCDRLTAPPRPQARDRVLSDDELKAIWRACERLGYPFGPVVKLLVLTGQRRAEVAGMMWAEIDLKAAIWRIPKERCKNGKAHEIDLSPQALAVLNSQPRNGVYVFPARSAPARSTGAPVVRPKAAGAVRGFSAAKRRLDELVAADGATEPWRLHDLRRTAATGMASMNFPPHIVERVLNHISGAQGGLVGVYQRHDYRPDRKAALMAWGARVATIVRSPPPKGA